MVPAVPAGSTMVMGDFESLHKVGDAECRECFSSYFPKPCADPECPGLVHEEFLEESWDSYYTTKQCDLCGGDEHV